MWFMCRSSCIKVGGKKTHSNQMPISELEEFLYFYACQQGKQVWLITTDSVHPHWKGGAKP